MAEVKTERCAKTASKIGMFLGDFGRAEQLESVWILTTCS